LRATHPLLHPLHSCVELFIAQGGSVFFVCFLDGPQLLTLAKTRGTLKCNGEGYPRPTFRWIELDANNLTHQGQELVLCDAISFQRWKRRELANESEMQLNFQCVAIRDARVETKKYEIFGYYIDTDCARAGE
jgi:hypothetical protein